MNTLKQSRAEVRPELLFIVQRRINEVVTEHLLNSQFGGLAFTMANGETRLEHIAAASEAERPPIHRPICPLLSETFSRECLRERHSPEILGNFASFREWGAWEIEWK